MVAKYALNIEPRDADLIAALILNHLGEGALTPIRTENVDGRLRDVAEELETIASR